MKSKMTTALLGTLTLTCQAELTIVETATAAGTFKTLTAALGAADLATALNGDGPFTVFAPTDDAFAKLPKGTVASLLKPENKGKLQAILKYHVVSGNVDLSGALEAGSASTLQGESVSIGFTDGKVNVNNAALLTADLKASNGVIHVIDSVLLPTEPKNGIASGVENAGHFNSLHAALEACYLDKKLSDGRQFTVFAPTDEAFAQLPKHITEALFERRNIRLLGDILANHVIEGMVPFEEAIKLKEFQAYNGRNVEVEFKEGHLTIHGATVTHQDIAIPSGLIHVVDKLILPAHLKDFKAIEERLIGEDDPQPKYLGRYIQPLAFNDLEKVESPFLKRYLAEASPDGKYAAESWAFSIVGSAYRTGFSLDARLNLTERQKDGVADYLNGDSTISGWLDADRFRRDWGYKNLTKKQLEIFDEYIQQLIDRRKRTRAAGEAFRETWGKTRRKDLAGKELERFNEEKEKVGHLFQVESLAEVLPMNEAEYNVALEVLKDLEIPGFNNDVPFLSLSPKDARRTILRNCEPYKFFLDEERYHLFVDFFTGEVEMRRIFRTLDR